MSARTGVIARRRWLGWAAGVAASASGLAMTGVCAWAQDVPTASLPLAGNLAQEVDAAARSGKALVVMVSLHGCPFCRQVRDGYLVGLWREGQPVVQVDMQSGQPLRDLAGTRTTHGQQVQAWRVRIAPTLLFLGRGGREVQPRLVGLPSVDFYGAYLDERVLAANRIAG